MSRRPPRSWPAPLLAALTTLLTTVLVLLTGLPAQAAPTDPPPGADDLRAQVAELTAQVETLEVAVEVAAEDWNTARAELDALLQQEVDAQVSLDDAGRTLDADQGAATRRIRALYRSGGTMELAWTALHGAGFADAATTYRTARVVLDSDAVAVERAGRDVDAAVASSTEVQRLRRDRMALEAEAEQLRQDTETALAAHEALLAGTDEDLVEAVERERQEVEREAVAYALAQAEARARETARSTTEEDASTTSSGAVAGPSGGTVPAGFVGGDVDQGAVVEAAAEAAPNATAAAAIRAAATRLGMPYVWGATGPGTFDCSGLTMWSYRQAGLAIPRTSRQQYAGLPTVGVDELLPGDLVFYASGAAPSSIHHVAMYLGDGLMIQAPRKGDVVKISAVWRKPIYGAVRPTD
ncbi:NlpC/P60 family protein [Aquipuribacter sp. MA13-6]|uniref:C40 family peptidase n=1 Tax=Aquipuribacter sp. MA13-6 TaxID=3440839 RepID=UPI003EE9BE36